MVVPISIFGLLLALLPTVVVLAILFRWSAGFGTAAYATARMLVQLLLIGYVLVYIFEAEHPAIVGGTLAVMLVIASWIAIRPVRDSPDQEHVYRDALVAVSCGGLTVLAFVTQIVIDVAPWFDPQYVIPLAGMVFAGAMNSVSLAAERLSAELSRKLPSHQARKIALRAALIPITNSLFAVGLVSLPGMMTGQILSGVSPIVAAKYQIVVMSMFFGVSGISAATYLALQTRTPKSAPSRQESA